MEISRVVVFQISIGWFYWKKKGFAITAYESDITSMLCTMQLRACAIVLIKAMMSITATTPTMVVFCLKKTPIRCLVVGCLDFNLIKTIERAYFCTLDEVAENMLVYGRG